MKSNVALEWNIRIISVNVPEISGDVTECSCVSWHRNLSTTLLSVIFTWLKVFGYSSNEFKDGTMNSS